jgi:nicotinamide phosphoribosyltransferase
MLSNKIHSSINKRFNNMTLKTDTYKLAHWEAYKALGLTKVFSYFEARKGAIYDTTTFVGLQPILHFLQENPITMDMVDEGDAFTTGHIGPNLYNRAGWEYIVNHHGGRLPIVIKAIPEGTEVPKGNALLTIENTDPNCPWITNHLETFLTQVWFPSTVATLSKEIKKYCKRYLDLTSDNGEIPLKFMLHDFGERGVSSMESAGMGGMAHLVNFYGSDTVEGVLYAREFYKEPMAAYSVIATEHSIMTSRGSTREYEVIQMMLEKFPKGILSLVLDSYNIYEAVDHLTTTLLDKVKAREGKVVIRPDSGEPVEVLARIYEILTNNLGSEITINSKGFKVLPSYIGVIWGDGLDIAKIQEILEWLLQANWSAENIVFGMGGGLLQKVNRDTQAFAFKCSANQTEEGIWNDVWKDPIDSSSGKSSKKGCLKLIKHEGAFMTVREDDLAYSQFENELKVVFENGEIKKEFTFAEVRKNAQIA